MVAERTERSRPKSQPEGGIEVLEQNQINDLIGRDVYGSDGGKIGTAVQVYADDETGNPEWVTVRTGLFGTKVSFVPLADASVSGDEITVPYDKALVKSAPSIDENSDLSQDEERELYAYYGRSDYDTTTTVGTAARRVGQWP
jgi:sporulation protein YlmC with PRC-barrel domain